MTLTPPPILDDTQLLHTFVATRSPEAFRHLVDRHLPPIHAAASRILRSSSLAHHADDIVQTVFILLAQDAAKIPPRTPLIGWLYQVTHYACANLQKTERRRRLRETSAMRPTTSAPPTVSDAEALLDPALMSLSARDRDVLLLRYAQNLPIPEIARLTHVPPTTAKKRLRQALQKLRRYFAAQGMLSAAPLALHGLAPAPSATLHSMASAITNAALAPATTATTTSILIGKGVTRMLHLLQLARLATAGAVTVAALLISSALLMRASASPTMPVKVQHAAIAESGVVGDPGLVQHVIDLWEANQRALLTWQGEARVTTTHSTATEQPFQMIAHVVFVQDFSGQKSRWSWNDQMASQEGKDISASKIMLQESGMRTADTFYRYMPPKPQPDGTLAPGNLILLHNNQLPERYSSDFDAKIFYLDNFSFIDNLRIIIALQSKKSITTVTRAGDRVIVETSSEVGVYRMEFDLSRSGNLVLARNTTPEVFDSWNFDFEKINGVWVPSKVTIENAESNAAHKSYARTWQFAQNRVNEVVPPNAFAWESMGVKPGDNIHDNLNVRRYVYDEPPAD